MEGYRYLQVLWLCWIETLNQRGDDPSINHFVNGRVGRYRMFVHGRKKCRKLRSTNTDQYLHSTSTHFSSTDNVGYSEITVGRVLIGWCNECE